MTLWEALNDDDKAFYDHADELADQAFDDQCTGANPYYPLIRDLKTLYILAYCGCRLDVAMVHSKSGEREIEHGGVSFVASFHSARVAIGHEGP